MGRFIKDYFRFLVVCVLFFFLSSEFLENEVIFIIVYWARSVGRRRVVRVEVGKVRV